MSLMDLVAELAGRGVRLEVDAQERLVGHGPGPVEDLLDQIRQHRDKLIEYVKNREVLIAQGRPPQEAARLALEVATGGAGVLCLGSRAGKLDDYAFRRRAGLR